MLARDGLEHAALALGPGGAAGGEGGCDGVESAGIDRRVGHRARALRSGPGAARRGEGAP